MTAAATERLTLSKIQIQIRRREHGCPALTDITKLMSRLSEDPSARDITETVSKHPLVAMRLMRAASSPLYACTKVTSVMHAVNILGVPPAMSILATICLDISIPLKLRVRGMDGNMFLMRSLAVAQLCRMLGAKLMPGHEESLYLAGLLQDSGYLGLAHFAPEQLEYVIKTVIRTPNTEPAEVERTMIGVSHAEVSGAYAEEYNLHESIVAAITYHHDPIDAPPQHQAYADIANLASWIADTMSLPLFPGCPGHKLDPYACRRLGINPDGLDGMQGAVIDSATRFACVLAA